MENSSANKEVFTFPSACPNCHEPTETNMCLVDIPHFKQVILMSLLCEHCGFKSNEVKGGGAISARGSKLTLNVRTVDDLTRDVVKSDTAGVEIPELELVLQEGGLEGLYTTVEGLIYRMHERLASARPLELDQEAEQSSSSSLQQKRYQEFLQRLKDMADGKTFPFTVVINDPLGNSFVGPILKDSIALSLQAEREGSSRCYDDYLDEGLDMEEYERTDEQNELLGLKDMRTENYAEGVGYYGTDTAQELPERPPRRLEVKDHPHRVGKAPVEGDSTIMGRSDNDLKSSA